MRCCLVGAVDPNKLLLVNMDSELVVYPCLLEFVGAPRRIFLIAPTMNAVNREKESRSVVEIRMLLIPLLRPNNLCGKRGKSVSVLKTKPPS